MTKFIEVFSRFALVLSLLAALILSAPVVAFSLWLQKGINVVEVPGQSVLSKAIVHHPVSFVWFWWIFSILAVTGSIGLMRRRRWGAVLWIVLLSVLATWCLMVIISETLNLTTAGPGESPGLLPSFQVMSALGAIPVSLVIGVASVLLLRKLWSHRNELATFRAGE